MVFFWFLSLFKHPVFRNASIPCSWVTHTVSMVTVGSCLNKDGSIVQGVLSGKFCGFPDSQNIHTINLTKDINSYGFMSIARMQWILITSNWGSIPANFVRCHHNIFIIKSWMTHNINCYKSVFVFQSWKCKYWNP